MLSFHQGSAGRPALPEKHRMATEIKPRIEITMMAPFGSRTSKSVLRRAASSTLEITRRGEVWQLSIALADDDTLRRLNREYRGLDEVTDVLAFSTSHQGQWQGEGEPPVQPDDGLIAFFPPEEPNYLGEVVISYPQAARQAASEASGLEKELAFLAVHGILHLMGFDHVEAQQEAEMRAKEQEILSTIFR